MTKIADHKCTQNKLDLVTEGCKQPECVFPPCICPCHGLLQPYLALVCHCLIRPNILSIFNTSYCSQSLIKCLV